MELRGSRWGEMSALCPVHGERRPSLRVNLEKGVFFCNSCGAKGTAIDLIRAMENCDREAAHSRAEAVLRAAGHEVGQRAGYGRYSRPGAEEVRPARSRYVPPGRR